MSFSLFLSESANSLSLPRIVDDPVLLRFSSEQNLLEPGSVNIFSGNALINQLSLDIDNDRYRVEGLKGYVDIRIKNKSVSIVSASCKHKTCMNMEPIRKPGENLICIPNQINITIAGKSKLGVDASPFRYWQNGMKITAVFKNLIVKNLLFRPCNFALAGKAISFLNYSKHNKGTKYILIFVLVFLSARVCAQSDTTMYKISVTKYLMGTTVETTARSTDVNFCKKALLVAYEEMQRVENLLSCQKDTSEISYEP